MRVKKSITCIPGYNWCGPLCSGPQAPVNQVDRCCKKHDQCYEKYGYFSCSCNRALLRCLKTLTQKSSKAGRTASLIYELYTLLPCFRESQFNLKQKIKRCIRVQKGISV